MGNVRVTVMPDVSDTTQTTSRIVQLDLYYPFGMQMPLTHTDNGTKNNYLYNGKELQTEKNLNEYDYGARFYDPAIGRWTTVDPSAEKDAIYSPYIYAFNNPGRFTDPDGRWPDEGGVGNGLSVVENVYLEGVNKIAEAISTTISWGKSLVGDSPMQEGKVTYSNGEASMSMTNVPEGGKTGAMLGAGLNVLGSIPGGGPGAGLFAKAPGVLSSLVEIGKDAVKAIHGNSKLSTAENTLYRLETKSGEYLKTGITSKAIPEKRYTEKFMKDKNMIPLGKGSRADMLKKEREIVEKNPGPWNKEPWAGRGIPGW